MRRLASPLAIATLAFVAAVALEFIGLQSLWWLDQGQVDSFVRRHAAALAPDPDIVIIDIDEPSFVAMQDDAGSWPWPRAIYAELIDKLELQKPAAIVFDILFAEKDRDRPESDASFADSLRTFPNVYLPMVRLPAEADARKTSTRLADYADVLGLVRTPRADPEARAVLEPPTAVPPEFWRRSGTINFDSDRDGVGRSYWLRMDLYGWDLPSLPVRVAHGLGFRVPDGRHLLLSWRGDVGSFHHVSFGRVYQDLERAAPQRFGNAFRNKIVIIGTSASGLGDLRLTPRKSVDQGVEILATAIEDLKSGSAMHAAPERLGTLLALLLIAGQFEAFRRKTSALPVGIGLAAGTLALLATSYGAAVYQWRLPVLVPLIFAWVYYLVAAVIAYLSERLARERAVRLFGRFLNAEVVSRLVERGETVESLSGKPCQISVLFSDIRGFTTLSETRQPQEIVALLNRYFQKQAAVVFRHGGTLDKFIGDCIMAFWGAPLAYPDHAQRAVACALEMQRTLKEFRAELGAEGKDFDVGIGVHTGTAVVGFIGAEQKLDYTAIGDTVNLASRVEGLTKGVARILVTAATAAACGSAYVFKPRGAFPVKGRAQPVDLFEPEAT